MTDEKRDITVYYSGRSTSTTLRQVNMKTFKETLMKGQSTGFMEYGNVYINLAQVTFFSVEK